MPGLALSSIVPTLPSTISYNYVKCKGGDPVVDQCNGDLFGYYLHADDDTWNTYRN